jgi:hypothetical protein
VYPLHARSIKSENTLDCLFGSFYHPTLRFYHLTPQSDQLDTVTGVQQDEEPSRAYLNGEDGCQCRQ